MNNLLIEKINDVEIIQEEHNGSKFHVIQGVYLQSGVKNRNNRIYPPPLMEREAMRYINEKVKNNNAWGELDHPAGRAGVSMQTASHLITELRQDRNDWIGKARLIPEGMGKVAIGMIQIGGKLGVSSRGTGSLREDRNLGCNVVNDDFRLHVAADIVSDPSAPDAFVNAVMENVNWILREDAWVPEHFDHIQKEVHKKIPDATRKLQIMENFISRMVESAILDRLQAKGAAPEDAASALKRAKIHAKLTGQHGDETYIYNKAKELLGS